eukprot:comp22857_c0_seq2/m.36056 comp22857_c0_seq2/g.36056  ORF comp22857_c0_seq2/g.36056 comp22857_c0_seq2/m.36056 type:complete len:332 (-) comp22857_c0_seq2:613-1608(-)
MQSADGGCRLIESTCEKFVGRERFEKYRHILEDRLTVCITNLATCQPRRITRFPTYELFVLALLASCRATPIAGFPFKMDGQWVADGGITDLQPVLSEHTVTVAPLYFGNSDIRPSRAVPIWWAVYPPGPVQVAELFELGYADASAWMDSMGYAEAKVPRAVPPHVADHLPVPTSLNRLYSLQDTPLGHAVLPQLPAHRTDPIRAAGRTTRGSVMFLGLVAELFEDGVSLLSVLAHGLMLLALFAVRPTIYVVIYLELLLRAVVAYLVLLLWPQVQSPGQATVQAHSHYHESRMACSAFLLGTYQRLVSGKRWGAWLMQRSLAARVMYITL